MKTTKMFGKKRLSAMMAAAFSFGAAFSLTPSDALAATVEIAQVGTDYVFTVDGTPSPVSAKDFAAKFNEVTSTANNDIFVTGGARSLIANNDVKIALGTTLSVNKPGDTNYVTLKNGAKESVLKVDSSGVTGKDVNLESLTVKAKEKTADLDLTGNVGELSMDGASIVNLKTTDGTLKVSNLNVNGTKLDGAANIEATTANLQGAKLNGMQLKADTVTVDKDTKFDNAKVKAKTVMVNDASADAVANLIKNGTIAAASDSDKLNVNTSAVTDAALKAKITELKNVAATDVKSTYTPADFAGGKLMLDGQEYSGDNLAAGIAEAFKKGAKSFSLDKDTAKAIKGQRLTVPATKTLTVSDGANTVTATTAKDSVVKLEGGTKVTAESGALSSVTVDAPSQTVNADLSKLETAGDVTVKAGNVEAGDKVTAKTVTIAGGTIKAGTLKAEKILADDPVDALKNITNLNAASGGTIQLAKANGTTYTQAELNAIATAIKSKIPSNQSLASGDVTSDVKGEGKPTYGDFDKKSPLASVGKILAQDYTDKQTAKEYRKAVGDKVTALNATSVAATFADNDYNPFTNDVAIANKTQVENVLKTADYTTAQLQEFSDRFAYLKAEYDKLSKEDQKKLPGEYLGDLNGLVNAALKAAKEDDAGSTDATKAARAKAIAALNAYQASALAYQSVEKGKIAAGVGVTASRTASVINDVIAGNIANRTADLRAGELAAAAPTRAEGTPNNIWFQIRHSNQDVETGSTGYADSKVKATTYQLGYDYQVSDTDYLGLYLASTTGSAEFNGAFGGSADIKSSFDAGLYGTHVLTNGQYLDYYLHKGKFSLDHMGASAKTDDFGAMVGYGVKIRNSDDLIVNPYINFAYDKLSFDAFSYANGNTVSADDQTNFSTKLGVNFDWTSGLTAGIAYSRGFSGTYNPYINGIALPGVDNDYNVFYLSLGYKNYLNPTTYLNVSVDKTFADYKGWIASGRVNFFF